LTFTYGTAGAVDRSSIVRGDVAFISGAWANDKTNSTSSGTIVTGGSVILAHGVTIGSAIVGSAVINSAKNESSRGVTAIGQIRVEKLDTGRSTSGDWWAVTRV